MPTFQVTKPSLAGPTPAGAATLLPRLRHCRPLEGRPLTSPPALPPPSLIPPPKQLFKAICVAGIVPGARGVRTNRARPARGDRCRSKCARGRAAGEQKQTQDVIQKGPHGGTGRCPGGGGREMPQDRKEGRLPAAPGARQSRARPGGQCQLWEPAPLSSRFAETPQPPDSTGRICLCARGIRADNILV